MNENESQNNLNERPQGNLQNGQPNNGQPQHPNGQPYNGQQQYTNGQPYNGQQQYPNGQPYYGQPQYAPVQNTVAVKPAPIPATEKEKEAVFSVGGSLMMLIFCIFSTLTLITGFIGNILSLNFTKLFGGIFDILTVVGLWVIFATAKKKKLSSAGVTLIKVPFIIVFIFNIIGGSLELIGGLFTFVANPLGFIISLITFVFSIIYFSSIKKLLNVGQSIEKDKSAGTKSGGNFAAVVCIILAVFSAAKEIISAIMGNLLLSLVANVFGNLSGDSGFIGNLIAGMAGGLSVISYVVIALDFLVSIFTAVMIIKFNKARK